MEHIFILSRINILQQNIETLQPTDMQRGLQILENVVALSIDVLTNNNDTLQMYKHHIDNLYQNLHSKIQTFINTEQVRCNQ